MNEEMFNRLITLVAERRLQGTEIAEKTGYSPGMVSNILNGKTCPSERFIRLFCSSFGVSEEWLKGGDIADTLGNNKFQDFVDEISKKEGPEGNGAEVLNILGHLTRMGDKETRQQTFKDLSEYAAKRLVEISTKKN